MNNIHCRSCYYRNKGRTEWENELAPLLEEVWVFTQPFTLVKEIHPRVRKIYESKFKLNPNEVFRDGTKRHIKTEPEVERFYRKIACTSEQISTIGNVRP